MKDFFHEEVARHYDERNSNLAPINNNMHFLVGLILKDLPARARILCVGVGTGAEIISLAEQYPGWSFVGLDPSAPMLDVCRKRLGGACILDRCTLVNGYVQDVPAEENFDAVLSILVAHFVKRDDRPDFYRNIRQRLKAGGYLVSAEISFDLDSPAFPLMLENWSRIQTLMGATPEQLQALPYVLRHMLDVLSPSETENILRASGIPVPVRFFQSLMISGWYGRNDPAAALHEV